MKKILIAVVLSLFLSSNAFAQYTVKNTRDCDELSFDDSQCDLNGNPITGIKRFYNNNGVLDLEITYKDGRKEGITRNYYENGTLMNEKTYKNGKLEGLLKDYYRNGNLQLEAHYKNGMEEGIAKFYYETGNLRNEGNYKNGKPEGLAKIYYETGHLRAEANCKNGKAVSGYNYDKSGKKTKMTNDQLNNFDENLYLIPPPF